MSSAVWIVVLGLLYALPELVRLPRGEMLAQAAVVVESTIELSLRRTVLALGLMAAGYLMLRTRSLPVGFGVVLVPAIRAALGMPPDATSAAQRRKFRPKPPAPDAPTSTPTQPIPVGAFFPAY